MADYAISNVPRRVVYAASGTGPYAFTFEILDVTDISVYKASTLLTLTTDYTVTINANGTGSVTLVTTAGTSNITIVGAKNIQRTSDFTTGGDLFANTLNDELDNQTIFIQQVAETAERGLKAPVTDPTDIAMTLPAKDGRKGKVLAFDSTTGNPVAGPALDAVVTVIEQSANINTVADNIGSVNTVAGNISNVNTVAGVSSGVTTVATNIANVNAVGADLLEPTSEINTVAVDIANVNNVGNNISNVNTVAGVAANVTTVAGISSNVTTVAGVAANVTTVAGISSSVTTVATNNTNVSTVATNIANVNAVGTISANVTTVAGIAADVTSVAGNATDISAVSAIDSDVSTVAGIAADISTVASDAVDIAAVAADIAKVIEVANDLQETTSEIDTVATNIANVNTVGTNIADVNSVADATADIATVADNLTDIYNYADTYQGAKATAPSVRNDSSALQAGDLYFNTTDDQMKVFDGAGWGSVGSTVNGTSQRYRYIATSGQTTFTGSDSNSNTLAYDVGFIDVYLNGLRLDQADYTATSGDSIVLASAAALNDELNVVTYGNFELADVYTKSASDARFRNLSVDIPVADIDATGTPSASTFLRGDGAWETVTQTRVSGGTTGLTPSTLTGGDVTLGGTLAVANGGTGLTSPGTSGNVLTSNGTGWTSSALPSSVTSLLGATGAVGTGGITAGTTYTVWTDQPFTYNNAPQIATTATTYADWRNASSDSKLWFAEGVPGWLYVNPSSTGTQAQVSLIAFNAGTYRIFFNHFSGVSTTGSTVRVLVDGTQQYSVSQTGTANQSRSADITVTPFSVITVQMIRSAGSGVCYFTSIRVQSSNGGLITSR
jgi:hypothetical protein